MHIPRSLGAISSEFGSVKGFVASFMAVITCNSKPANANPFFDFCMLPLDARVHIPVRKDYM